MSINNTLHRKLDMMGKYYSTWRVIGILLTLSTSLSVDLQLVRLLTSVTEPLASTAKVFTGTFTTLPVSTAVFKISVLCRAKNTHKKSNF